MKPKDLNHLIYLMKLSVCQLVLIALMCNLTFATDLKGQKSRNIFVVEFEISVSDQSISSVFEEIERKTNFRFFYDNKTLKGKPTVSISEHTLGDALASISHQAQLNFHQVNQVITVEDSKDNPGKEPVEVDLIDTEIQGKVTDSATGEALIGATVQVKNTQIGTITDVEGRFKLNVPDESKVLVVTYIGYSPVEVDVANNTTIEIALEEDLTALNEVVVIGYGTQTKANLTGAISQVESSEIIEERPVVSVGQALQGTIPGLTVSRSNGIPGEGYSFNIRGYTSINGGTPLVLVDGAEMDPDLIPPSDIQSITVLKDAASAAIYGARAAFGVILITTKSGAKASPIKFTYTNNISSTRPTTLPDKVDPVTQIRVGGEQWKNAGRTPGWYWGRNVQTWTDLYESPDYVPNTIPVIDGIAYPLGDNNNMIELMTESSLTTRHDFSVSGGSDNTTYYLSAGIMNQDGVLVHNKDKYSRKNILMKVDTDINSWLKAGATLGITRGVQNMPYIPNNEFYVYSVSYLRPTFWLTGVDEVSGAPWGFSPAMIALGAKNTFLTDNANLQLRATLTPLKGLSIHGNYTHRTINSYDSYHVNTYEQANPTDGPGVTYKYRNDPNSLHKTAGFDNYNNFFLTSEYTRTIGGAHNLKAMIGYNQEESAVSSFYAARQRLISDDIPALSLATGNSSVGDDITEWSTRSGLFRINYDFRGKYLLEVVGRYDGSSRFEKENRFIFSPSASAGWLISDEQFMSSTAKWLNTLKIRASYGTQGNQQVGAYSYLPNMSTSMANWIINGERPLTINPGGLVSDQYTWEKVNTANLGLDFGFLRNRLQATIEIYQRETEGMLTAGEVLPVTLGTSVPQENAADLKVNGWELDLSWSDEVSTDFSYDARLILYDDVAEITRYENPTGYLGSYYVGQKLGEIWGYTTDRLFQESDFTTDRQYVEGIPTQDFIFSNRVPFPGDVKYADLNNDGEVDRGNYTLDDHGDLSIIGNSRSRYQFGLQLGATYKAVDLSIFLQGVAKKDLWTGGAFGFTAGSQYESIFVHTMDYWSPENTDAFYPRPDDRSYNKQVQTRYLLNAAYMRLKMVRLGYTVPRNWLNKIGVNSAHFYITGENLLLLTGLPKGMDPELGPAHTFPLAKDFSVGTTITF